MQPVIANYVEPKAANSGLNGGRSCFTQSGHGFQPMADRPNGQRHPQVARGRASASAIELRDPAPATNAGDAGDLNLRIPNLGRARSMPRSC